MRILNLSLATLLTLTFGLTTPAWADGFQHIKYKSVFVSLMDGRELTRFGINMVVTPDGRIDGRAFGQDVTGAWRWQDGYFCREMVWGTRSLAENCQLVKIQGRTVRFIADKGAGDIADLQLSGG